MKKSILSLFVLVILIPTAMVARAAGYGLEQTAGVAGLDKTGAPGTVSGVIGNVIGAGLALVGVLFFVLMIYAGIRWMTARGNEDQSKKAIDTITAAIIGLIVVVASYAITQFVFRSVGTQSSAPAQSCVVKAGAPASCSNFGCSALTVGGCTVGIASLCCVVR